MTEFFASIDRKKLMINVVGYALILILWSSGPSVSGEGFLNGAIKVYLVAFPAYYLLSLFLTYRREKASKK